MYKQKGDDVCLKHQTDDFIYYSKLRYMIPKVEIEAGKADLIREILGVNDLQDINLLDEYRDIFIKSQKSAYKNESVNDINCTD